MLQLKTGEVVHREWAALPDDLFDVVDTAFREFPTANRLDYVYSPEICFGSDFMPFEKCPELRAKGPLAPILSSIAYQDKKSV